MDLTVDINAYCNLRCEFCYQDLDGSILPEDEILGIIDENPDSEYIEIGGGEPFLDKRLVQLIKEIRKRKKKIHIATNGTRFPDELLNLEDMIRNDVEIQISLHASNQELYKRITKKNLFDRVIDNIKKIKPMYSTLISSAIYQVNYHDIPNLINLASELELPIRINLVFPVGNGRNVELLTPKQINQLTSYLLLERIKKGNMVESPLMHTNNCTALQNVYGIEKKGLCPVDCGVKGYISPKGKSYNCEFLQNELLTIEGAKWTYHKAWKIMQGW